MKTIFELKYSDYYSIEEFTDGVKFFEKLSYNDLIEFLITHNKDELLSVKHLIKHAEDEFNEYLIHQHEWCCDEDECTFEEFKEEFIIEDDFSFELYEFLFDYITSDQLEKILNEIGIKFGTVGYSPWCYYIALDVYSDEFINDMYNGYNWYDIVQYSDDGAFLDSCGGFYITNEKELIQTIKGNFFTDDKDENIYLVENDTSAHIEHEKIKKVQTYYEKRFVI